MPITNRRTTFFPTGIGFLLLFASQAFPNTMTYVASGQANVVITTSTNSVSVQLTDLYVNPTSVADNLSALLFTLNGTPTSASIASSSANSITVDGGGSSTPGSAVTPGWALSLTSATTKLDDLASGGDGPAHTVIGAPGTGGYTNANGSIAGNGPHNPFLNQVVTWSLTEMGVTASTSVTSVIFQFGTTDGQGQIAGILSATPEPSSMAMLGAAGLMLVAGALRRRKQALAPGNAT